MCTFCKRTMSVSESDAGQLQHESLVDGSSPRRFISQRKSSPRQENVFNGNLSPRRIFPVAVTVDKFQEMMDQNKIQMRQANEEAALKLFETIARYEEDFENKVRHTDEIAEEVELVASALKSAHSTHGSNLTSLDRAWKHVASQKKQLELSVAQHRSHNDVLQHQLEDAEDQLSQTQVVLASCVLNYQRGVAQNGLKAAEIERERMQSDAHEALLAQQIKQLEEDIMLVAQENACYSTECANLKSNLADTSHQLDESQLECQNLLDTLSSTIQQLQDTMLQMSDLNSVSAEFVLGNRAPTISLSDKIKYDSKSPSHVGPKPSFISNAEIPRKALEIVGLAINQLDETNLRLAQETEAKCILQSEMNDQTVELQALRDHVDAVASNQVRSYKELEKAQETQAKTQALLDQAKEKAMALAQDVLQLRLEVDLTERQVAELLGKVEAGESLQLILASELEVSRKELAESAHKNLVDRRMNRLVVQRQTADISNLKASEVKCKEEIAALTLELSSTLSEGMGGQQAFDFERQVAKFNTMLENAINSGFNILEEGVALETTLLVLKQKLEQLLFPDEPEQSEESPVCHHYL